MEMNRQSLIRIAAVSIIYILFTYLANNSGLDRITILVSISATIPIICGILFGANGAIGILIGCTILTICGNFDPMTGIVLISSSGAVSLCAYKGFLSLKKSGDNDFIYNSRSLLSFLLTSYVVSTIYYLIVAKLSMISGKNVIDNYVLVNYDIVWTILIIGILVILFVPIVYHKQIIAHPIHEERWRYVFFIPIIISEIIAILHLFCIELDANLSIIICIVSLTLFGIFGPTKNIVYNRNEFRSVKFKCFRFILIISTILSILLLIILDCIMYMNNVPVQDERMSSIYRMIPVCIVYFMFTIGSYYVEKKSTKPIYDITESIRNDEDINENELKILVDRLDFVAKNKTTINGNDFILFIGLTKRDGSGQFETEYARTVVDEICLRYVDGYVSSNESVGGYRGKECTVSENVLTYRILGANDEMIRKILDEVTKTLEQESVLVIKNGVSKSYYFGN